MLPFALVITVLTSACRAESLPQLEPGKDPFAKLRRQMVAVQLAGRDIRDEEVLRVMMRVPRHLFVGEKWREYAYADHPLQGRGGQVRAAYAGSPASAAGAGRFVSRCRCRMWVELSGWVSVTGQFLQRADLVV